MTETISTVELAAELTSAWLSNSNTRVSADDVPAFLMSMHSALAKLADGSATNDEQPEEKTYEAATTPRKSLSSPDHIISMIDGKKYKTLRRHLTTNGMTPDQYRGRYNLKADYPMVAATYSDARREMAKKIGLGRKPGQTANKAATKPASKVAKAPKAAPPEVVGEG